MTALKVMRTGVEGRKTSSTANNACRQDGALQNTEDEQLQRSAVVTATAAKLTLQERYRMANLNRSQDYIIALVAVVDKTSHSRKSMNTK